MGGPQTRAEGQGVQEPPEKFAKNTGAGPVLGCILAFLISRQREVVLKLHLPSTVPGGSAPGSLGEPQSQREVTEK